LDFQDVDNDNLYPNDDNLQLQNHDHVHQVYYYLFGQLFSSHVRRLWHTPIHRHIAGFDFGCITDGSCDTSQTVAPLYQYSGVDGIGQMQHFSSNGMNIFRLPIGWQILTPTLGGTLDATNWAKYDELVKGCLNIGAHCIIDIHNYARWNGNIINQSGGAVTNAHFVSVWTQIATKYASQSRVVFGIMNEPHDVPDINIWAATVQAVVTAIRNAGATSQMILLPGNNWTSAQTFVSSGSAAALSQVKNPNGSITNLIFDVHKYLDSDNSGTHVECTTDNIQSSFLPLAQWLRCNGRQAFLSETGGGNVQSCVTYMCAQLSFIKHNSDVFLGYTGWSAGAFYASWNYVLTEVPNGSQDTLLVSSCLYQQTLP
ncbi:Endoglucanase EG-II, partial [Tulasnella sp. 408]